MTDLQVTVAGDYQPCEVCGAPTKVRVNGRPGTWACLSPRIEAEPDLTADGELRLLEDLANRFAPTRHKKAPRWLPKQPEVLDLLTVNASWSFTRPHDGAVTTLDRSGAWISAAATCAVAWGELEHTGPGEPTRPGLYKVAVYEWNEPGLPHPLGSAAGHGPPEMWVTHERAKLLTQLAHAGRWPDAAHLDSWTSEPARLHPWATHVNRLRTRAITEHGRDSAAYAAVKINFSQAIALMIGSRTPGQPRTWKCRIHRPDWSYTIQDAAACNLWRVADKCHALGAGPVSLQHTDELGLDSAHLELVTTGERPPIVIDPTGTTLGTFKIKATSDAQ